MSKEEFEKIQDALNEALVGKDSPVGKNSIILGVNLHDVVVSSHNYLQMNVQMYLQEKPKRYTWIWVAEWPDGTFANIRSEKDPWYNHASLYYYKEPIKVYKIEESKQETLIE